MSESHPPLMTGAGLFAPAERHEPLRRNDGAGRSMRRSPSQRPLSDYALIGNTHTAALVASDGAVDWCCLPHFDSGAVFCRLLDPDQGGFMRVGPVGACRTSRRYVRDTAVLETDFDLTGGRVRATDFMHSQRIAESRLGVDDPHCHRLLRRLECVEGRVDIEVVLRPTFDFAREPARLEPTADGARAVASQQQLLLCLTPPQSLEIRGYAALARIDMRAGDRLWVVLSHGNADADDLDLVAQDPDALLDETYRHWGEWARQCSYDGPYRAKVLSSARVLKLLTFAPTGALVAAPTTSLPEVVGGAANWDYRFCWLRDAALVLHALMSIGYHGAAMDFFHWLEGLCDEGSEGVQIMYRLDGGRELPEQTLEHLSGYRGSSPVRIGNGAAGQLQLDVFGHVLDAALVCLKGMYPPVRPELGRMLRRLADQAAARWREPDRGIWESRGSPRHFLSSKLMCWVALDRALQLVEVAGLEGDADRWRQERDAIREAILERGYDANVGAFTQALGSKALDASVLLMPLVGFLPASDKRMRSTVDCIRDRLTANGLVYRYLPEDGIAETEGTFAICSYWMVDNLALQGRTDEARALFEQIGAFASDLGLLSEEIDPASGELLGNYPQGFTHLALIRSALAIARAERHAG